MNERELLPCPFCGNDPIEDRIEPHKHFLVDMPDYPGAWSIECVHCEYQIFDHESREFAVKKWNCRVDLSPLSPQAAKSDQAEELAKAQKRIVVLEDAIRPFAKIAEGTVGRIPHEKLSAYNWHTLWKALAATDDSGKQETHNVEDTPEYKLGLAAGQAGRGGAAAWTLITPEGKRFSGATKWSAFRAETNSRIPADVQLQRILAVEEESEDRQEFWWLIEGNNGRQAVYATCEISNDEWLWTVDAHKAARFPSKDAAERVLWGTDMTNKKRGAGNLQPCIEAVEHGFIYASPPPARELTREELIVAYESAATSCTDLLCEPHVIGLRAVIAADRAQREGK